MRMYHVYPIPAYNKYIGKPLYKFSKKHLGKSKLLAMNMAVLPSSVGLGGICYGLLINPLGYNIPISLSGAVICFLIHQTATPSCLLDLHKHIKKQNKKSLDLLVSE